MLRTKEAVQLGDPGMVRTWIVNRNSIEDSLSPSVVQGWDLVEQAIATARISLFELPISKRLTDHEFDQFTTAVATGRGVPVEHEFYDVR